MSIKAYNASQPMADKVLNPDGSLSTINGEEIQPASPLRARQYELSSPIAAKWLLPDGTITDVSPSSGGSGGVLPPGNMSRKNLVYGEDFEIMTDLMPTDTIVDAHGTQIASTKEITISPSVPVTGWMYGNITIKHPEDLDNIVINSISMLGWPDHINTSILESASITGNSTDGVVLTTTHLLTHDGTFGYGTAPAGSKVRATFIHHIDKTGAVSTEYHITPLHSSGTIRLYLYGWALNVSEYITQIDNLNIQIIFHNPVGNLDNVYLFGKADLASIGVPGFIIYNTYQLQKYQPDRLIISTLENPGLIITSDSFSDMHLQGEWADDIYSFTFPAQYQIGCSILDFDPEFLMLVLSLLDFITAFQEVVK